MVGLVVLLALLTPGSFAAITLDYNCTVNDAGTFKWAPSATICEDTISDAACKVLYAYDPVSTDYPAPTKDFARAPNCFSADTGTTFNAEMKKVAVETCPKTCGYCCETTAYKCSDVQFPRLNCKTITAAQCRSSQWRVVIAQDCPTACGFCGEGGCVDGVLDCANDISICNAVGMQDFVNQYCQKTCQRCPSTTTTSSGTGGGGCTSFIANSSPNCAAWAANGFCTNNFYTSAQRRAYCATTCRIC